MAIRRKVIAGAAAALAVGGAGAGVAATKLTGSQSEESKAIVNDAAKTLGVEPGKLSAALKQAFENRIDAAVAAEKRALALLRRNPKAQTRAQEHRLGLYRAHRPYRERARPR